MGKAAMRKPTPLLSLHNLVWIGFPALLIAALILDGSLESRSKRNGTWLAEKLGGCGYPSIQAAFDGESAHSLKYPGLDAVVYRCPSRTRYYIQRRSVCQATACGTARNLYVYCSYPLLISVHPCAEAARFMEAMRATLPDGSVTEAPAEPGTLLTVGATSPTMPPGTSISTVLEQFATRGVESRVTRVDDKRGIVTAMLKGHGGQGKIAWYRDRTTYEENATMSRDSYATARAAGSRVACCDYHLAPFIVSSIYPRDCALVQIVQEVLPGGTRVD